MKYILILISLFISTTAFAQDAAKASDKPIPTAEKPEKKEAPESVTLPAATVKELEAGATKARLATVEAENLALKIQQAQVQLKEMQDNAKRLQDENNAAFVRAAVKAGVPGDDVSKYEGQVQADGSMKLTKKTEPKGK